MGDVQSSIQKGDQKKCAKKKPITIKEQRSITHFLSIPTNLSYSDSPDGECVRYNFKHSFKNCPRSIFNSAKNKQSEIFAVGEVEFTILLDIRGKSASRKVTVDTYITSESKNVTFVNGNIFVVDSDGKLVLYKMFSNVRNYNRPQRYKLGECSVNNVHEKWILEHKGEIEFLFVGNILVSNGYFNVDQVEMLLNKLKGIPAYDGRGRKYLFDAGSDVIFQVGERKFHAHKEILAERSNVFQEMCFNSKDENILINCDDLTEDVVAEMLLFIYTDTSPNIKNMPISLLKVADKYGLDKLKLLSEIELTKILDKDNVDDLLNLAKSYNAQNLREFAREFMNQYLESVALEVQRTSTLKVKSGNCILRKAIKAS